MTKRTHGHGNLSKCLDRIKEYRKEILRGNVLFYIGSLGERVTVGAKCKFSENEITSRYEKCGVLRHILAEDISQPEMDLRDRLAGADTTAMHALNANIDHRAENGTDAVTMWENTEIRVAKPELSWKDVITDNLL
jgi:hypothetical protein